jgi:hypothetical protein
MGIWLFLLYFVDYNYFFKIDTFIKISSFAFLNKWYSVLIQFIMYLYLLNVWISEISNSAVVFTASPKVWCVITNL